MICLTLIIFSPLNSPNLTCFLVTETIVSVETKHRTGNETSLPPICHRCLNSIDRCAFETNLIFQCFTLILKLKIDIFRGPFITAMGKTWCPAHFCCSQATCQRSLQEVGFVEEKGKHTI